MKISEDREELRRKIERKARDIKLYRTLFQKAQDIKMHVPAAEMAEIAERFGELMTERDREPSPVSWVDTMPGEMIEWQWRYKCGGCDALTFIRTSYCGHCGRKMAEE